MTLPKIQDYINKPKDNGPLAFPDTSHATLESPPKSMKKTMLKKVEEAKPVVVEEPADSDAKAPGNHLFNGIPIDLYRYFNIELSDNDVRVERHLKRIAEYSKNDLKAVRDIENKLGQPAYGEKRLTKIYNYISMLRNLEALENANR